MKRKEIIEKLRAKKNKGFDEELKQNHDRLWSLKQDLASGKVKNASEIKLIKKNIARILTFLKEEIKQ